MDNKPTNSEERLEQTSGTGTAEEAMLALANCFVSLRELSVIWQLAPRYGADLPDGRLSRDIIKNLGRCTCIFLVYIQFPFFVV